MSQYGYVDHALANYFAVGVGLSEAEGAESLRKHLGLSPELRQGLAADLDAALKDSKFSWSTALAESDVVQIENELKARAYARRLLCTAAGG